MPIFDCSRAATPIFRRHFPTRAPAAEQIPTPPRPRSSADRPQASLYEHYISVMLRCLVTLDRSIRIMGITSLNGVVLSS